jgi:hypothetical protein
MNAANPTLDTASQRLATGMDEAARQLILNALVGCGERIVFEGFLRDSYADLRDYASALEQVWGAEMAENVRFVATVTANEQSTIPSFSDPYRAENAVANAVLLHMPEPDFRLAVFQAVHDQRFAASPAERITSICKRRGIPWEFTESDGFVWTGDAEVEELALHPALSAIQDPRFAGTKNHFDAARSELAQGTPTALRQSVLESACAVEGAMKVVLTQHCVAYNDGDTAFPLFKRLVTAGIVPQLMEYAVLGAASPRNKLGGHGGEEPHEVPQEIAEAVASPPRPSRSPTCTSCCRRLQCSEALGPSLCLSLMDSRPPRERIVDIGCGAAGLGCGPVPCSRARRNARRWGAGRGSGAPATQLTRVRFARRRSPARAAPPEGRIDDGTHCPVT